MKNEVEQGSSAGSQDIASNRRAWVKPEVKSAEVAHATLNGHAVPPITDFATCAS